MELRFQRPLPKASYIRRPACSKLWTSTGWLVDWLIDWLIEWLIDWLIDWFGWLIGLNWMDWLIWLIDSIDWFDLFDWLIRLMYSKAFIFVKGVFIFKKGVFEKLCLFNITCQRPCCLHLCYLKVCVSWKTSSQRTCAVIAIFLESLSLWEKPSPVKTC